MLILLQFIKILMSIFFTFKIDTIHDIKHIDKTIDTVHHQGGYYSPSTLILLPIMTELLVMNEYCENNPKSCC